MRDLMCVGNSVADTTVRPVEKLPERGKLRLVEAIGLHGGGCALNSAIASARLGLRVGIGSAIGRDSFGNFLERRLTDEGVDVQTLMRDRKLQTSTTVVLVSKDGERSFLHTLGASAAVTDRIVPDRLLHRYRALHLSALYILPKLDGAPARRLLIRAKRLGLMTSLDTCWDPKGRWGLVKSYLPYVDYYLPSYEEACAEFKATRPEQVAAAALQAGVRRVVVLKMGAKGCFAMLRNHASLKVPAFRVRTVDATGAGDSFDAGFLAGVLRGFPLEQALKLGCAAGALSVAGTGGVGLLKSFQQARRIARR